LRPLAIVCLLLGCAAVPAAAQVEVDRVLVRVGDQVITHLDVRRARLLQLVPAEATTDDAVQHALENHWLMVAEVARFNPAPPDRTTLDAERERWRSRFEPGADTSALLERAGMSEAELEAWLQDELAIRTYLDGRFGGVPAADRPGAIANWIRGLRERAGLR
jgi:hypothetical protein